MNVMFNISYGLYILTAKTDKLNGCVINALSQVTSSPNRIMVADKVIESEETLISTTEASPY